MAASLDRENSQRYFRISISQRHMYLEHLITRKVKDAWRGSIESYEKQLRRNSINVLTLARYSTLKTTSKD
jgi:hypothetical protein